MKFYVTLACQSKKTENRTKGKGSFLVILVIFSHFEPLLISFYDFLSKSNFVYMGMPIYPHRIGHAHMYEAIFASVFCDVQVLVNDDLLGLNPTNFRFVKKYANLRRIIDQSARLFKQEVMKKCYIVH